MVYLDAANDAHSGFTLLNHLSTMIGSVSPPPLPAYYTFDLMFGYLYHTSTAQPTRLWQAHNPNYDPGPPPVKVIKPAKEKTENRQTDTPADTQHLATGHNQEGTNRPTKSKHWRKNRGRGGSVRTHPPSTRTDTGPHATHLYS